MRRNIQTTDRRRVLYTALRFVTALAIFLPLTASARQWTLEECIRYAVQNNLTVKKRAIEVEQRDIQLNTSRNSRLPEVSLRVGEQFSFGNHSASINWMDDGISEMVGALSHTTGSLDASVNIFNGFRINNSIKADQYSLEAATADLEQARKDIGIQVSTQYLQCLYYRGMAEVARSQVEVSRNLLDRATYLVEEGKRPLSEQKEFESVLASDRYSLAEAEGNFRLAILALKQFLNLPSDEEFDVCEIKETHAATGTADAIYEDALRSWPAIRSAEAMVEEGSYRVKVARSSYYPSLALKGGVSTFYIDPFHQDMGFGSFGDQFFKENLNEVIGLQLSVPIFNRLATRNNVRKAEAALRSRKVELAEYNQNLQKEIHTAYTNAEVAREKESAALKAAEAASVSLTYEQERYEAGRGNSSDIQRARQKYINATQKAVQAKYEYMIRQRILEFYQGGQ